MAKWMWKMWAWAVGSFVQLRICYYDDGLDEIFLSVFGVCVLHLEKMDTNSWWMGLYATKIRTDQRRESVVDSVYTDREINDTLHVRWITEGDIIIED